MTDDINIIPTDEEGNQLSDATVLVDGESAGGGGDGVSDHGADAHTHAEVIDGDGIDRQIWVIESGADDPAEAEPEDLIFEKEA